MLPDSDKNSSDLRQQRLAMLLRPVSLPLKLSSGDLEIPFSLLGSCLSQPCWREADGWKGIHQAWKLCLIFCNSSFGSNRCHFRINRLPPPRARIFMVKVHSFTATGQFLGRAPSVHTRAVIIQARHSSSQHLLSPLVDYQGQSDTF